MLAESRMTDSIPSANKILQPLDAHMVSTGKYIFGSKNFQSRSGLLFEAKARQERYEEQRWQFHF